MGNRVRPSGTGQIRTTCMIVLTDTSGTDARSLPVENAVFSRHHHARGPYSLSTRKAQRQVKIHPLALVSADANLGVDVSIGPFVVIEAGVSVGDRCVLESHAVVKSGTTLGHDNYVGEGAVLGGAPQHAHPPERIGRVVIGDHNTLREHVTIHRAMHEGAITEVGSHNLLMCNVHVAHDCRVGSQIIMANNTMLAGHVHIADRAFLSGGVAVHQFCRVGRLAMVGGQSHVVQDIPPYVLVDGGSHHIVGLNLVGLRRAGFSTADIDQLKAAYRLIYRSGLMRPEIMLRLQAEFSQGPAAEFYPFFQQGKRGYVQERRVPPHATIKLRAVGIEDDAQRLRRRAG